MPSPSTTRSGTRWSRGPSTRRVADRSSAIVLLRTTAHLAFHGKLRPSQTCKLWDAYTGQLHHTLRGHSTEIVCVAINPQSTVIATGSMDNTAKLWDVERGVEIATLLGHSAEIVALSFNTEGGYILTGSFDHTCKARRRRGLGGRPACAVLALCLHGLQCTRRPLARRSGTCGTPRSACGTSSGTRARCRRASSTLRGTSASQASPRLELRTHAVRAGARSSMLPCPALSRRQRGQGVPRLGRPVRAVPVDQARPH